MSVISDFPDSREAWQSYKKHHLTDPKREFDIFFTGNESIEVYRTTFYRNPGSSMKINMNNGLPTLSINLSYNLRSITLDKVLVVDKYNLNDFDIQLGMTKEPYGFDAILGVDFFIKNNLKIDFEKLSIY